ncbi:hypothetical protein PM082_015469 [Marasmius tenuissimus]|nr:hypothetical protein PM082_015469 [Marasmius tenuissimus]
MFHHISNAGFLHDTSRERTRTPVVYGTPPIALGTKTSPLKQQLVDYNIGSLKSILENANRSERCGDPCWLIMVCLHLSSLRDLGLKALHMIDIIEVVPYEEADYAMLL